VAFAISFQRSVDVVVVAPPRPSPNGEGGLEIGMGTITDFKIVLYRYPSMHKERQANFAGMKEGVSSQGRVVGLTVDGFFSKGDSRFALALRRSGRE